MALRAASPQQAAGAALQPGDGASLRDGHISLSSPPPVECEISISNAEQAYKFCDCGSALSHNKAQGTKGGASALRSEGFAGLGGVSQIDSE